MPRVEGSYARLGSGRASYSFATDGGAVATIPMRGISVPAGATILGGYLEVTTPPTSGGAATVAVTVEAAGDMQAAAVVTGAPWSTAGRKSIVPVFTGASTVRTTTARVPSITVAVATLTAGVFDLVLIWVEV